jgi:hypothetical protein
MQTGQHVWFIGFMGAGKSHWAARTADVLGLPLIDLDGALEAATGRTVAALFDELGEAGFRALEAEEVRRVAGLTAPHVIATGTMRTTKVASGLAESVRSTPTSPMRCTVTSRAARSMTCQFCFNSRISISSSCSVYFFSKTSKLPISLLYKYIEFSNLNTGSSSLTTIPSISPSGSSFFFSSVFA